MNAREVRGYCAVYPRCVHLWYVVCAGTILSYIVPVVVSRVQKLPILLSIFDFIIVADEAFFL